MQHRPLSAEPLLERLGARPVHEPDDVERRPEGYDERQGADVAFRGSREMSLRVVGSGFPGR